MVSIWMLYWRNSASSATVFLEESLPLEPWATVLSCLHVICLRLVLLSTSFACSDPLKFYHYGCLPECVTFGEIHQYPSLNFRNNSCFLIFQAISFSNLYAPEHLIVNVKDAEKWESFIENAGSDFCFCPPLELLSFFAWVVFLASCKCSLFLVSLLHITN